MKKNKSIIRLLWISLALFFVTCSFAVLFMGFYVQTHFETDLPNDFFRLSAKGESPKFFIYQFEDRTNRVGCEIEVTDQVFAEKQTSYLSYAELPKDLINAFVAIEDKRFFDHDGVDWYRTLAASLNYMLGFSKTFGASTITQQLVKNITGNNELTPKRKIQEMLYARALERQLDKTEILELYLNVIGFSDNCNGVAEAAAHYFSKTVNELTLAECACIAAITNSPTYYNPIRNPAHNLYRRDLILGEMLKQNHITKTDYEQAINEPLQLNIEEVDPNINNSWYTDMVIEDVINDLVSEYGISRNVASRYVYGGGLRIDMAMDKEIQETVEDHYQNAIRLPHNQNGVSAQSALIVIDSQTGDILGVAGAIGEKKGNRLQNFATQTLRPPGSAIKPISVYAPALEKGVINWASVYDDVPVEFDSKNGAFWPHNANGVYRGLTNIPYAVAHSTNTVAVRILQEIGKEYSYHFAKEKFHLENLISNERGNDCDLAALALGQLNYGITLRELSAAYSVFADGGVYHPYRSYYRVLDREGNILLSNTDRAERVISEANAAIMTKLLEGVIDYGTSSSITLDKKVDCAGKTGTSHNDFDRWFVGYTPSLICGVWCGYEYPEPLEGKNICNNIWNSVMTQIVAKKGESKHFELPASLVRVSYCKDSGKLLSAACEKDPRQNRAEIGYFLRGEEPTEFCDCHVLCLYDEEHGGVSHGNCPQANCKEIGLIRVERSFPRQILVLDAQYVYRTDPLQTEINPDPKSAYFAKMIQENVGLSPTTRQYNRSCTEHLTPKDSWDYLHPRFWEPLEE